MFPEQYEIDADDLKATWEKSVWLANSARNFADKSQKAEWERLDGMSAMDAFQEGVKNPELAKLSISEHIFKTLEKPAEISSQRLQLANEARHSLLSELQSGDLLALGFEPPRRLDDTPKLLPQSVWFGQINWDNSEITYQSLSFVDVRIFSAFALLELELNQDRPNNRAGVVPKSRGRPTVKGELTRCFDELNRQGQFDNQASFASHFPAIRDWLRAHCADLQPSADALSEKTIRKHLGNKFSQLQVKANQ